jgi:transcription initiation factor TFIIH subunit 2
MVPLVVHEQNLTLRRSDILLTYLRTYIVEWFDQNPLGQVGVVLIRDRLAETLVPMGGGLLLHSLLRQPERQLTL